MEFLAGIFSWTVDCTLKLLVKSILAFVLLIWHPAETDPEVDKRYFNKIVLFAPPAGDKYGTNVSLKVRRR
jgi:hypothetical protein